MTVKISPPPSKWERYGKAAGAVAASLVSIGTLAVAYAVFNTSVRTLDAQTRSQTSDRFVKAVEQLGNEKSPDIRIGGIYGLEQLARDTPSDHPAVFGVLTAFVRHQAPAGAGKCSDPTLHLGLDDQSPNASPDADVEAAVDAIARRNPENDRKDARLDLSHTCLVAANWEDFQLAYVSMRGADLRDTDLSRANLHGAFFVEANLADAHFDGAHLTEAFLAAANLTGTHLEGADLSGGADLYGANLTGAHLDGANLSGAKLMRADLSGADLHGANLSGAKLMRADLSGAHLGGANLSGAHVDGGTNLSNISYDGSTIWPNGFQPPRKPH
jgi:uncharacterized protein YjbI with pentapeptide repeats